MMDVWIVKSCKIAIQQGIERQVLPIKIFTITKECPQYVTHCRKVTYINLTKRPLLVQLPWQFINFVAHWFFSCLSERMATTALAINGIECIINAWCFNRSGWKQITPFVKWIFSRQWKWNSFFKFKLYLYVTTAVKIEENNEN